MMSLVSCPDCGAPAEITERFGLPSTDGPVEELDRARCGVTTFGG